MATLARMRRPLNDGPALLGGVGCQGIVPGGVPFVVAGAVRRVLSRGIFHVAQSQRLLAGRWPLVAGLRPGRRRRQRDV